MNMRVYGRKPYTIVAVHGGPDALVSLAGLAGDIEAMPEAGLSSQCRPFLIRWAYQGVKGSN